jgi:ABC-type multidrug transport system fused ATPase/permease subunit
VCDLNKGGDYLDFIKIRLMKLVRNKSVVSIIYILSTRDRISLIILTLLTGLLAILDLIGVALIGIVASLSLTNLEGSKVGDRVSSFLQTFSLTQVEPKMQVLLLALVAVIAFTLKTILSMILVRKSMLFMARRSAEMSRQLIVRYFTNSVQTINKRPIQTTIYALTDGVTRIMIGVFGTATVLASDIVLVLILAIGLFIIDPISAVSASIIFGGLAYTLYRTMHVKVSHLAQKGGALRIEGSQKIYETISAYRELLVRDRRGYYVNKIGDLRLDLANYNARMSFMVLLNKYIFEIVLVIGILGLAFYQVSTSSIPRALATISIFVAASTRIMPAILRLQTSVLTLKSSLAEATPTQILINEVLSITPQHFQDRGLIRDHGGFVPEIKASRIFFGYEKNREVLKEIDFSVKSGEFVAIVGGSGAGKTTLVDLILGALEPTSGYVEISGDQPIKTYAKWPGAVAYVPQDCPVINGSIRENLGLGYDLSEISDEFCWESLKIAQLSDFVRNLQFGLDTHVGDRGTQLSGGQRQRLGIARAMITRPKLLILDEATSALDGITEFEIADSLKNIQTEVTLLLVAHRLSTIKDADRIYLLSESRVSAVGTFSQLKATSEEFASQARLMGL